MEKATSNGDLLDRKTAAAYLHICPTTLSRLDIPKTKIRRRVLYRQTVLEAWVQKNTEERP